MRSVPDFCKFLCWEKNRLSVFINTLFHYKYTVILCIIDQIDKAVTGKGVRHAKTGGHDTPFIEWIGQIFIVDDLIVIAVHDKVGIFNLSDIGWDT